MSKIKLIPQVSAARYGLLVTALQSKIKVDEEEILTAPYSVNAKPFSLIGICISDGMESRARFNHSVSVDPHPRIERLHFKRIRGCVESYKSFVVEDLESWITNRHTGYVDTTQRMCEDKFTLEIEGCCFTICVVVSLELGDTLIWIAYAVPRDDFMLVGIDLDATVSPKPLIVPMAPPPV